MLVGFFLDHALTTMFMLNYVLPLAVAAATFFANARAQNLTLNTPYVLSPPSTTFLTLIPALALLNADPHSSLGRVVLVRPVFSLSYPAHSSLSSPPFFGSLSDSVPMS